MAVVVVQFFELSPPTPEDQGSNPGKIKQDRNGQKILKTIFRIMTKCKAIAAVATVDCKAILCSR